MCRRRTMPDQCCKPLAVSGCRAESSRDEVLLRSDGVAIHASTRQMEEPANPTRRPTPRTHVVVPRSRRWSNRPWIAGVVPAVVDHRRPDGDQYVDINPKEETATTPWNERKLAISHLPWYGLIGSLWRRWAEGGRHEYTNRSPSSADPAGTCSCVGILGSAPGNAALKNIDLQ